MPLQLVDHSLPIAPSYRRAIFEGSALQTLVVLLSGFVLDFGQATQICGLALLAFWSGTLVLIWRHRLQPTPTDLSLIWIGFLPVVFLTAVLAPAIWRLRGVW